MPQPPFAASGNFLALLTANKLSVLDASLNEIGSSQNLTNGGLLAAVPGGWLLAHSFQIQFIDTTGAASPAIVIPHEHSVKPVALVYGAAGRVLLLWRDFTAPSQNQVKAIITMQDGTVVVAPFILMGESLDTGPIGVTSNESSFFVGPSDGTLRRYLPDGTLAGTVSGYRVGWPTMLTWGNSIGWYIAEVPPQSGTFFAQRFDGSGAPVGTEITLAAPGRPVAFFADGDALIAAISETTPSSLSRFSVIRFDQTGAIASSVEVGVGFELHASLFANGIALTWSHASVTDVATVAIP